MSQLTKKSEKVPTPQVRCGSSGRLLIYISGYTTDIVPKRGRGREKTRMSELFFSHHLDIGYRISLSPDDHPREQSPGHGAAAALTTVKGELLLLAGQGALQRQPGNAAT